MNHPELVLLPANQPKARFYRGGQRIADFRSAPPADPFTPEDWIASVTTVRGQSPAGLSRLPTGELLMSLIADHPLEWLGAAHVESFGVDTKLLVKLLDAGQRLPVHAHPDAEFAAMHLGASHGKAEAWYILSAGTVHLGLRETVDPETLLRLVADQRTDELLAMLHAVEVQPGDSVYVPPGVLHAIGPGILLAEVQEPEDLSILLEWNGFDLDGARDGHLGLGFERALTAVEHTQRSDDEIRTLVHRSGSDALLPAEADRYFRLDQLTGAAALPAGFAVLIGLSGTLSLTTERGDAAQVSSGETMLVPFAVGVLRLAGSGMALVARPPVAGSRGYA